MRKLVYGFLVLGFIAACSTQKNTVKVNRNAESIAVEDTLEYDLETFDAKFESWYITQNNPALYRSQAYYESWNKQYVSAWNIKASSGRRQSIFEPIVGYDPNVDYGFDLNHHLFYYFQYVEHELKMKILPNSPKSVY